MKKIRIKGQLRLYLYWNFITSFLLVVMTAMLFTINNRAGVLSGLFTICNILIGMLIFIRTKSKLVGELVKYSMNYNQIQRKLMHELTLPYALMDDECRFIWMNSSFQNEIGTNKFFGKSLATYFSNLTKDVLPVEGESFLQEVHLGDKDFRAEIKRIDMSNMEDSSQSIEFDTSGCIFAIYLYDITRMNYYLRENEEQKLVTGLIYIDNYDEALDTVEEVKKSLLIALIDRKVNKWIGDVDGIVKKVEKDKYFVVMKQKHLKKMQDDKFSILDEVKKINIGNEIAVTLSIGIGATGVSYSQNYMYAHTAIDLALGRGGDQAVVKKNDKIYYYGGKTKQVEKNTRVKARVKAQALREIMETKETIFAMGHQRADIDSFGGAIGIYKAAKELNKKAYVVLNDKTSSIRPMYDLFEKSKDYPEDMFISGAEAEELIDDNSVLVVVDVNKPMLTEAPELLNVAKTIVVFDHHRQEENYIANAVLSYVEPYASSTCEMVAEMLQYFSEGIKIKSLEADCLYAGIMIDTNNFISKTGVRTFEAAAFLRRCGADVARVHNLFRENFSTYKIKAETVKNAELYHDKYAIAVCNAGKAESPSVIGAQAANELLKILGVKASFVMTQVDSVIYISARSLDEFNVHRIMERMGGGGHMNTAAAQIRDGSSIEGVRRQIKSLIDEMLKEGMV